MSKVNTYTIPTDAMETIEKAFARFTKKAQAYGCSFSFSASDPYYKERRVYDHEVDHNNVTYLKQVGTEMVEVVDVTIESDIIRKDGYSVAAKIEHLEGGNIVTTFESEIDPAWITAVPRCQHCGGNHNQKTTFIVRHASGSTLQVGRTCLKDYCGIDPQWIANFKQLVDLVLDEDMDHRDFFARPAATGFSTIDALAFAIRVNKAQGYVKSEMPNSNAAFIRKLIRDNEQPTEQERQQATELAAGICDLCNGSFGDTPLDNVHALIRTQYCKPYSHAGYIAYAPVAYARVMENTRREREIEAEKDTQRHTSQYVGVVGQRITIDLASYKVLTSWETQYGTKWLYQFIDQQGNVYIWFASSRLYDDEKPATQIKATIKEHSERDGVKQTVVARCTITK